MSTSRRCILETKLNKQLHGNLRPNLRSRGFFKNNQARKSFFWYLVGDATAYFIVFYFIGYIIGTVGVFYLFFWPMIKAVFGPLFGYH